MKLFSPLSADPNFMESKSISEKILILRKVKENILKRIEGMQNMVKNIDTKIKLLNEPESEA